MSTVDLSHQADRPTVDDDALYYDLLELVDSAEDTADEMAWVKGAAIAKIEARYGESRRQLFATEARIARSTAYEYAQMFRFWYVASRIDEKYAAWTFDECRDSAMVRDIARKVYVQAKQNYPSLRRTHFRYGMRIGRKHGVDAALAYLDDCQGRTLSIEAAGVEAARIAGKPVPPKPVWQGDVIYYIDGRSPAFELPIDITCFECDQRYRVVVYALESDAS